MILVCISLTSNVVEHILSCILVICLLSLKKCLFCSFTHFLIGLSFYCGVVRNSEFNFLGTEIQSLVVPLAKVFWMIDSPCLKNIIFSHLCFLLLSSGDSPWDFFSPSFFCRAVPLKLSVSSVCCCFIAPHYRGFFEACPLLERLSKIEVHRLCLFFNL